MNNYITFKRAANVVSMNPFCVVITYNERKRNILCYMSAAYEATNKLRHMEPEGVGTIPLAGFSYHFNPQVFSTKISASTIWISCWNMMLHRFYFLFLTNYFWSFVIIISKQSRQDNQWFSICNRQTAVGKVSCDRIESTRHKAPIAPTLKCFGWRSWSLDSALLMYMYIQLQISFKRLLAEELSEDTKNISTILRNQ